MGSAVQVIVWQHGHVGSNAAELGDLRKCSPEAGSE